MKFAQTEFITSASELSETPASTLGEVAFIGRSNVGKSSLLNMVTGRHGLAKTSSRPGKTELINFFAVPPEGGYLVDLPGYGYARRSMGKRQEFAHLITSYITEREQLRHVFVLVDSMISPQQIDLDFILWLADVGVPHSILFTKSDRLKKTALKKNTERFLDTLREHYNPLPESIITSSKTATGRGEIQAQIRTSLEG